MRLADKLQYIASKLQAVQQKMLNMEQSMTNLQAENEHLKQQLASCEKEKQLLIERNTLEHTKEESVERQEEVRALENREIHQQIDQYLGQIDDCIEWLRKQ